MLLAHLLLKQLDVLPASLFFDVFLEDLKLILNVDLLDEKEAILSQPQHCY